MQKRNINVVKIHLNLVQLCMVTTWDQENLKRDETWSGKIDLVAGHFFVAGHLVRLIWQSRTGAESCLCDEDDH